MDWSKGFSAQYYCSIVDPMTWRDVDKFGITGGSIKKSFSSDLKESADISCINYEQDQEQWVRIWLDARQGQTSTHVPLFTGLAVCPDRDIEGNLITSEIECYSVLKPAQDVYLPLGWYAPAEIEGATLVKQLLSSVFAPIIVEENSPTLQQAIIAEKKETQLSMAIKILSAINWRIKINGLGEITLCPFASEVSATFDYIENDIIETEIKDSCDWFDCPNVFMAIMDDISSTARDDSPDSKLSTVNRRREVWKIETDCDLNDGESIADYSERRLKELQQLSRSLSYNRRFIPDIVISDIVRINYPKQKISGLYFINEQSISLEEAGRTAEEVVTYG